MIEHDSTTRAVVKDILAGTISGVALTLVGPPRTIKTRMQCSPQLMQPQMETCVYDAHFRSTRGIGAWPALNAPTVAFRSSWHCFRKTFIHEGLSGFYRGVASPLGLYVVYNSVNWVSYVQCRRALGLSDRSSDATLSQLIFCGIFCGFTTTTVRAPMDLIKSRMQLQASSGIVLGARGGSASYHANVFECAKSIIEQGGIGSLYQGTKATLVRQTVGGLAWWPAYELSKPYFIDSLGSKLGVVCAGGVSATFYWICIYPFDLVKTRMQTDAVVRANRTYASMHDCADAILRQDGLRGFWRGLDVMVIRSFPANAALVLSYEHSRGWLDEVLY